MLRQVSSLALATAALLVGAATDSANAQSGPLITWTSGGTVEPNTPSGSFVAVSAGTWHASAIRDDGSLVSWALTFGNGFTGVPPSLGVYTAVASGDQFSMALSDAGHVAVWGDNTYGQISHIPIPSTFTTIAAGFDHCLAIRPDGTLAAWGRNDQGQCNVPAGQYTAIAGSMVASLAIRASDGSIVGWGSDASGLISGIPTAGGPFSSLICGFGYAACLAADGTLIQWGNDGYAFFQIPTGQKFVKLFGGYDHATGMRADGSLVGWGDFLGNGYWNNPPAGTFICATSGAVTNIGIAGTQPSGAGFSSAFTYQGLLTANGSAFSGSANLMFTLWNAPTGGQQIGTVNSLPGVNVSQGAFTVTLDFGPSAFASQPRYVEVTVDTGAGPTLLSPRQLVTSAPFANTAASAAVATRSLRTDVATFAITAQAATQVTTKSGAALVSGGNSGTGTYLRNGGLAVTGASSPYVNDTLGGGVYIESNPQYGGFVYAYDYQQNKSNPLLLNSPGGNVGIGMVNPSQKLTVNGNILAYGTITPSSIRFKDNVTSMEGALERLLKLDAVRFDWKPDQTLVRDGRVHDFGFVAEDVAQVFPEVVFKNEDGTVSGMDYSRLVAVAVQAIKEQEARHNCDRAELDRLKSENADLKARLDAIEKKLNDPAK